MVFGVVFHFKVVLIFEVGFIIMIIMIINHCSFICQVISSTENETEQVGTMAMASSTYTTIIHCRSASYTLLVVQQSY